MSTGLALQTVTNALRRRLGTAVANTRVHTRPPDRLRPGLETAPYLNLFLFEVLPNAAWRNQELPGRGGGAQLRPPLSLDLRYLLTAYPDGDDEDSAHGLLGQAMLLLHDDPVLRRAELAGTAPAAGVDLQVDQVRLSLMHLPLDELSKLWTAFTTDYRLSVVYQASVVLIDPAVPPTAPLPVLQRGSADLTADEPPTVGLGGGPVLTAMSVPSWGRQRGVMPPRHGETIALEGTGLGGTTFVRFRHPDLPDPVDQPLVQVEPGRVTAVVPAAVPVGFGTVAAATDLGEGRALTSNQLPVGVPPRITVARVPAGDPDPLPVPANHVRVEVTVTPAPAAEVPVLVLAGSAQLPARSTDTAGRYRADVAIPPGATAANPVPVPVRVRIAGIDSVPLPDPVEGQPLPVDWDPAQVVTLP
jgi:Pvc16 N-terminal domain